jgi:hypothetical protein
VRPGEHLDRLGLAAVPGDRPQRVPFGAHTQNLRRDHDELGLNTRPALRAAAAFTELAHAI